MRHPGDYRTPHMGAAALAFALTIFCSAFVVSAESPDPQTLADTPIDLETLPETHAEQPPERSLLSDALAEALSHSTEGLRIFSTPGGGTGVDLGDRFQHAIMVRISPDGRQEFFCVNHPDEAAKILDPRSAKTDNSAGLR